MRRMRGARTVLAVLGSVGALAACGAGAGVQSASLAAATGRAAAPAPAARPASATPTRVIGNGTPASCTSPAVVAAVAAGGVITFDCGPSPVTITDAGHRQGRQHQHPRRPRRRRQGHAQRRRRAPDPLHGHLRPGSRCWTTAALPGPVAAPAHRPEHDLRSTATRPGSTSRAVAAARSSPRRPAQGGQLEVHRQPLRPTGPDLGGAAIRALSQYHNLPVLHRRQHLPGRHVLERRRAEQHRRVLGRPEQP